MRDIYLLILIVAATIAAMILNAPREAIELFERVFLIPYPAAVGLWVGLTGAGIAHYLIEKLWKR